ncbi:MAG: sugar ABC transporter substrate-binding protein [Pirellulales bacterium]
MNSSRLAIFLCFVASIVLAGCGDSTSSPKSVTATGPKPKVALIMKSLANEFFSTMAAGAEKHNKENSASYELIVNGIKDERDLSRQVALVDEMIAMNVNAIVIAPADSKALVPSLRKAIEKGIIVVNIDNKLDADILAQENVQIPFVGPDNRAGAKAVAEHLASELKSGDEVLILEGIRTSFNAQQRLEGFKNACDAAGLKIVDSQSAEWEMSRANTIASAMLSEHPEAKAILAANDNMALGALASAKSAGRSDLKIVGFDNINAVQQAIREGKILATADQHGDQLAVFGIEVALELVKGTSSINKDANVETPVDVITADRF